MKNENNGIIEKFFFYFYCNKILARREEKITDV